MPSSADSLQLIDPICGAAVDAASQFRCVHGGALFFFCSDACRTRFMVDPSRCAIAESAADVPKIEALEPPPTSPAHGDAGIPLDVLDFGSAGKPAAAVLAPAVPPMAGERNLLTPLFAWRERRFAAACCRELLKLYRTVATGHPGLSRLDLYRQVVVARTGGDAATARAMLDRAEESFASWPVSRELNFRDVVHYLAVSEFVASHSSSRWIYADMKRVVESAIPHDL